MPQKERRSPPSPDRRDEDLLARARQALREQRWADALALATPVERSAERVENLSLALKIAGHCHWHLGQLVRSYRVARRLLGVAVSLHDNPLQMEALILASASLFELDYEEEAFQLAQRALQVAQRPHCHDHLHGALAYLATVYAYRGAIEPCESLLMQALSHARESGLPGAPGYVLTQRLHCYAVLHRLFVSQGHWSRADILVHRCAPAVVDARRMLQGADSAQAHPDAMVMRPMVQFGLGTLLGLSGEAQEGEQLLRTVLHDTEGSSSALRSMTELALADLLARLGRAEEAMAMLPPLGAGAQPWSYRNQIQVLQTMSACLTDTGDHARAQQVQQQLDQLHHNREALRHQARRFLSIRGAARRIGRDE